MQAFHSYFNLLLCIAVGTPTKEDCSQLFPIPISVGRLNIVYWASRSWAFGHLAQTVPISMLWIAPKKEVPIINVCNYCVTDILTSHNL